MVQKEIYCFNSDVNFIFVCRFRPKVKFSKISIDHKLHPDDVFNSPFLFIVKSFSKGQEKKTKKLRKKR